MLCIYTFIDILCCTYIHISDYIVILMMKTFFWHHAYATPKNLCKIIKGEKWKTKKMRKHFLQGIVCLVNFHLHHAQIDTDSENWQDLLPEIYQNINSMREPSILSFYSPGRWIVVQFLWFTRLMSFLSQSIQFD